MTVTLARLKGSEDKANFAEMQEENAAIAAGGSDMIAEFIKRCTEICSKTGEKPPVWVDAVKGLGENFNTFLHDNALASKTLAVLDKLKELGITSREAMVAAVNSVAGGGEIAEAVGKGVKEELKGQNLFSAVPVNIGDVMQKDRSFDLPS